MKLNKTSRNLKYSFEYSVGQIFAGFLSLILLFLFAYALYVGKIQLYVILGMSVILLLIFLVRFMRHLIIYLLVCYIETLDDSYKSRVFFLNHKLWLISNPLLYFMASNVEFDVKLRRILLSTKPGKLLYRFLLFIFYYPFTRLLYFHRKFIDRIMFDDETKLVHSRIEGYVIVWLFFFPFISGVLNLTYLICLYVFIIVFLYPLLSSLAYLLSKLTNLLSARLVNKQVKEESTDLKLMKMAISETNFSLISLSGSGASYPTIAWIALQRSSATKNVFGFIATLYEDNAKPHSMYSFVDLSFICGTDNKRALVWLFYYRDFISNQLPGSIETKAYISYSWYNALYDLLNDNWWAAWMFEFFVSLAGKHNISINPEELQRIQNIMSQHLLLMEKAIKLIWDIEKDWSINPLDAHPLFKSRLLTKGRSYPTYDDSYYLFADNYSLEAIKISLNDYQQRLDSHLPKYFDRNLEDAIMSFFIVEHVNIISKKVERGWGMFHEHGKHLMARFPLNKDNYYDLLVMRAFLTTPYENMKFRNDEVASALNYFYYEGFYFHPQGIREFVLKRLGENLAKWREEWEKK